MNCDGLARWYWPLEYLGWRHQLERRREQFLPEITHARRVLVLGDGDGRFLAAFLRANPRSEVDYVDLSAQMLALARKRAVAASPASDVRFHHADAMTWPLPPPGTYDLVVTHFFLDCFTTGQLPALLDRVAAATTDRALWIVSEFHQPAHGFAAWRARVYIRALYLFFRVVTGLRVDALPSYRPLLEARGFRLERAITTDLGLLVSELWQRV